MTARSAMLMVLVLVLVDLALFPLLIAWLRRIRFTQLIRDEGPVSHKSKAGTPTAGGLMLVLNIVGAVAAYFFVMGRTGLTRLDVAAVVFVGVSFVSGFLDDWTKEVKHRNDGLRLPETSDSDSSRRALFLSGVPIDRSDPLSGEWCGSSWRLGLLRCCHAVRGRHGECIQPDGRP